MCLYYFGNSSCGNRQLMFCTKSEADRRTDCQTNIQSVRSGMQGRTDRAKRKWVFNNETFSWTLCSVFWSSFSIRCSSLLCTHRTSHSRAPPPPKNTSAECFRMFPLKLLLHNFPSGFYNCPVKLALEWCDHISHKWPYVMASLIAIPCVCSASTLTPPTPTPAAWQLFA